MNSYYFAVTYWFKPSHEVYKQMPICAETYAQALESIYKDERIIGARLIALGLWSGRHLVKSSDLFQPSDYDVPNLAQF